MTVRINAFPAWYYPWLEWTFSGSEDPEKNVSVCMDVFGFSYYISLFISPLPGFLIAAIKKCTKSDKANKYGLNCLLLFIVVLSSAISAQMTWNDSPIWNAVLMTIEYSFLRTFFFISRSMVSTVTFSITGFLLSFYLYFLKTQEISNVKSDRKRFILVFQWHLWLYL